MTNKISVLANASSPNQNQPPIIPQPYLGWRQFKKKFYCGFMSGLYTGAIFGIPEFLKVRSQVEKDKSAWSLLRSKNAYRHLLKCIISFPGLVAMVGAAQFTANDQIRARLGKIPGIIASAVSGGILLAVGDHYMYRGHTYDQNVFKTTQFLKKNKGFSTGFTAVALRQSIFMTNVMYVGPLFGKLLQKLNTKTENTQDEQDAFRFVGRTIMGVFSTLLSHPFDCASRRQQQNFAKTLNKNYTFVDAMKDISKQSEGSFRPFFRGVAHRMWLGTFGGAVIAGLYERFQLNYQDKRNTNE